MPLRLAILLLAIVGRNCFGATPPAAPKPPLQEPWDESYANLDATGSHVLGCWKFDELPLTDATGRGGQLMLNAADLVPAGRFGSGFKSGALARLTVAHPHHSPRGAFTAEMWVKASAAAIPTASACLLDKLGAGTTDYSWSLLPPDERGMRPMMVKLGFGTFVKEFVSEPVLLKAEEWKHLAFSYDGEGKIVFHADGQMAGEAFAERCGALTPGMQPLHLGITCMGTAGFQGVIDEVRLCSGARGFAAFALVIDGASHVWERMERPLPMKIICTNLRREALRAADMTYSVDGEAQTFIFPDLEPGATNVSEFGPDTSLKPGRYILEVAIGKGRHRVSRTQEFHIVGRRHHMLPVVLDGANVEHLPQLNDLGFTFWTGIRNDDAPYLGTANKTRPATVRPRLEAGLLNGMRTVAALQHDGIMLSRGLRKVDRDGKEYVPTAASTGSPNAAGLLAACGNMFTIYYRTCGAWSGVMMGATSFGLQPGFSKQEREAYQKFSGQDIPADVKGDAVSYQQLPGFPQDRVVPDDHPVLKYYRWYWTEGNGINAMSDAWYKAYERRKQEHVETWFMHHPSVHQPSKAGSFGVAAHIGDQSGDTRDPLMAGLCMDQQLAMAAAHKREIGVFGILPVGWERALASPVSAEGTAGSIAQMDRVLPASRLTMAPALLKANLWTMLSRPLKGLVINDGALLCPATGLERAPSGTTHPQALEAMRDVADRLLKPLGPMLGRRQTWHSPVVLLESFTSQVMAGRGLYRGGASSSLEVWLALQRAHIQTEMLYEESLLEGGLDGRQILIMPDCDVLPASVVEKIRNWQKDGGKVLADDHLCPGLKADGSWIAKAPVPAVAPAEGVSPEAVSPPVEAAVPLPLSERLAVLCKDQGWKPRATCDHPDVVLHASRSGEATVLFVINDRREAGTYVGQHGLVKERGLPVATKLNFGQDKVNIYDLTEASFLLPKREDAGLVVPLELGPSEGRVLLLSPVPLLEMQVEVPETAKRGYSAEVRVRLMTSGGRPMPAAIPVAVTIRDADGAPAEFDGHHVVENGELTLRLDLARNETPGAWEIRVRELASGMKAVKWMQVNP
ncbi:MAG: LamG domain-containing protein [Prosthecobacter sp.]|jgi:hypothetical protein|uniref:LamG-like jellyroll fold domain-containing protein n=1 Tax=Prosthecobacter sp. TaxID=1965333 RepID=UPI0019EFD2FD|nr:LamG-like jellyroll fold domain-containing protein [Prosthecobacter sp.]MBE2285154.1 LamG domain-containing protein [Prosthecobacter sp.]